ncbi:MAG: capsular biosynthesis protein [Actinobacteria bacterium]|nr:MAG: capsular biosynthesis protein [Actinomycetota bacterium]
MAGVIDIHCHVLPGLDDGPANLPEALAMAGAAAASGTTMMVATPHIDHTWRVRPQLIPQRAVMLQDALRDRGIDLQIETGAEIAISRLTELTRSELAGLRLGSGPYLLLECPLTTAAGDFDLMLRAIHSQEESIVLAHPERSPLFQQEPARLQRLVEAGLLCSITAGSITGVFGQTVRRFSIELLREGLVHDLSSDAHDHFKRPPGIRDALASAEPELPGISRQQEWLTLLAPAAILAGEPLPPRPSRNDRPR